MLFHVVTRDANIWSWAPIRGPFAVVLTTIGSSNIVETWAYTTSLVLACPGAALSVWRLGQASLINVVTQHLETQIFWLMDLMFDSGNDVIFSDELEYCDEGFVFKQLCNPHG